MYKGKTVSVAIGTYREKKSIRRAIKDLFESGFVDEVIVVNNNAEKGTDEEIKKTKAKLFYENHQGYGWAYQKAMEETKGDYIITSEADGTFKASDIERLLVYSQDYEVVQGSRTSLIGSLVGIDGMSFARKYSNVLEAKTIEFLFNTTSLTDVGCTLRLIKRGAYERLKMLWKSKSVLFNTEIIILCVTNKIPFVEIPVAYHKRVGKSQVVGNLLLEVLWGIRIQAFIIKSWINYLWSRL